MGKAYKENHPDAFALLQEYEMQTIHARVIKMTREEIEHLQNNGPLTVEYLMQRHNLRQLEHLYKITMKAVTDAGETGDEPIKLLYSLRCSCLREAIDTYPNYEEKYKILRKLRAGKKLSGFEKKVLDFNFAWFSDRMIK